jgi:hypothetical protein
MVSKDAQFSLCIVREPATKHFGDAMDFTPSRYLVKVVEHLLVAKHSTFVSLVIFIVLINKWTAFTKRRILFMM